MQFLFMRFKMGSAEVRRYLNEPLLARLATNDGGWPHVVPVWFEFDGESFWVPAQAKTTKVEHIRRDKRVGLVVDTYAEPISKFNVKQVIVKGEAELVRDSKLETNPSASRTISIYGRYLGKTPETTDLVARLLKIDRYLIKIKPVRIVATREKW
jgi:nitroimidazol reductase NimA-like FMN-containing flavoprotein (pyridoxamine 5'-phosphate oxidase superfamily)